METLSPNTSRDLPAWELAISLARSTVAPPVGSRQFARVVGGPNDMLVWMESQLGLHAPADTSLRLAALNDAAAAATSAAGGELAISTGFRQHPYAVVARVLEHRDLFLMAVPDTDPGTGQRSIPDIDTCGLATARSARLPEIIQQYAGVMAAATDAQRRAISSGEPDRLAAIVAALREGQRLPACRIVIADDRGEWPGRWQGLLDLVQASQPHCIVTWTTETPAPHAVVGTALHVVQQAIDGGGENRGVPAITEDGSLRTIRCASVATASQATAAALANLSPAELAAAVIVCEDDLTAALIDGHLHGFDLPTMGIAVSSHTSDIHSLLPLAIEVAATPADPQRVKEFLSLADSPVPWAARRHLQRALDDLPAVGSPAWNDALATIAADTADGAAVVAAVDEWIPVPPAAAAATGGFNHTAMAQATARLAEWANRRAQGLKEGIKKNFAAGLPDAAANAAIELDSVRRSHYQSLHAACRALELFLAARQAKSGAAGNPPSVSRTEYLQLLDAVRPAQPAVALHPAAAGAPTRVRSFAEIDVDPVGGGPRHVMWIGTTATPAARSRWIHADIERMRSDHDLELDASPRHLVALRRAERVGLRRIAGSLLIVVHPSQDSEGRPHPFWLTISEMLYAGESEHHGSAYEPRLVDCTEPEFPISPWRITRIATTPAAPLSPVDRIELPNDVALPARKTVSYSEATRRLTCPVAWTFSYGCGISSTHAARQKNAAALEGSAMERVMREVFEPAAPVSGAAALAKLEMILADRLPFIHAGLCQPAALADRQAFERALRGAVPVMQCLIDGGVSVSFGVDVGAFRDAAGNVLSWNGLSPTGAIDVLGSAMIDGRRVPIVIDEKRGSAKIYRKLLKSKRCWQLVLYADLESRKGVPTPVDAIGYFVLSEGRIYVPAWAAGQLADARFRHCVEVVGEADTTTLPGQAALFQSHLAAAADAMHQPGAIIQAHPRVAAEVGAVHGDLALVHGETAKTAVSDACKYCDYGVLCGKDQVR